MTDGNDSSLNTGRSSMNSREPEPRTAVMIMVEASWADRNGTLHKCSATMENTSKSGARVRLRKPIRIGTKLQVQWRWEHFTGTARYCHSEGKDYVVGIQKDAEEFVPAAGAKAKAVAAVERQAKTDVVTGIPDRSATEFRNETTIRSNPTEVRTSAIAAPTQIAYPASEIPLREISIDPPSRVPSSPAPKAKGLIQRGTVQRGPSQEVGKVVEEKIPMRRRWFGLGHREESQDDNTGIVRELAYDEALATPARATEANPEPEQTDDSNGIELLSMTDIYQTAGIRGPRKGYSINKVVEMLRSEHLRGLSKEMKRASVLVALDAAGISLDEVVEDAKARVEAIDSYEASQRKQFEAHLVRRAEENQQIMAELERVKATYAERLRRNLDGVAREKATFGNWLTLKQQETANITEALELCTKSAAAEPAKTEINPTLISSKPV